MSFLSYISDPIPLVLIGGISGVGKTAVLDSLLLQFPNHFQQPISYTSRQKRSSADRYMFVSEVELVALFEEGHLLNLDNTYGNLYGISKKDVHEIRKQGKIPIKEVHPIHFQKIKSADPTTITVIVENKHLSRGSKKYIEREGRDHEEESWLNDSTNVDVFLNTAGSTPEECASLLAKKLFAFRRHISTLPHPGVIDRANATGYAQISREFVEERRITTRNFHDASRPFWATFFLDYFVESSESPTVLELGSGNGWLFNNFEQPRIDVYGVDIADGMRASYVKHDFITSARSMPFNAGFFDYVVASLADPFLYPEVIVEVSRLLKKGGRFAFTYPSSYWADSYPGRKSKDKTVFLSQDHREIEVYSICRKIEDLFEIFLISGLRMEMTTELYLPEGYEEEIAVAISDSATAVHRNAFSMPIVVGGVFRKE